MRKKERILVVGFGAFAFRGGKTLCKSQIADYLTTLAQKYEIVWLSQQLTTAPYSAAVEPSIRTGEVTSNLFENYTLLSYLEKQEKFSAILAAYPAAIWIWPYLYIHRTPIFFYVGNDFLSPKRREVQYLLRFLVQKYVTLLLLRKSRGVIARGAHLADICRKYSASVAVTIPIMTRLQLRKNLPSRQDGYVLFVGNQTKQKGYGLIVAAAILNTKKNVPNKRVVVVGATPDIIWGHVPACIEHRGYVTESVELQRLYEGAVTVVCPSTENEGVPRVIEEACVVGVPVWSTKFPTIFREYGANINYFESCPPSIEEVALLLTTETLSYGKTHVRPAYSSEEAGLQHLEIIQSGLD